MIFCHHARRVVYCHSFASYYHRHLDVRPYSTFVFLLFQLFGLFDQFRLLKLEPRALRSLGEVVRALLIAFHSHGGQTPRSPGLGHMLIYLAQELAHSSDVLELSATPRLPSSNSRNPAGCLSPNQANLNLTNTHSIQIYLFTLPYTRMSR